MSNKLSLYINGDWVVINNNGREIYQDIISNFKKDYGKDLPFENAEYNTDVGVCIIDGVQQDGKHNLVCDDILESLYDIMAKKNRRGYIVPQSMGDIQQAKINELKYCRDKDELSPVKYNDYSWDFDEKAQARINGAIIALADGGSLTWTSADNQEINDVTAEDLKNVIKAAAVRSNALHVKYRELKAQVEQAETQEQVEAIVW